LADVLKALADPIRLEIVRRMCVDDEVACTKLEEVLDVSKSTISYHIKVLYHADLVEIRKAGRFYFYSLRRDVLESYLPGFSRQVVALAPATP
jgi:DNA-binding transcriptional ArsR family regulator